MANFNIGETVIINSEVKNSAGTYVDPSTSMKITITDSRNTRVVDDQAMTKDSVGQYHYDYTAGAEAITGKYLVSCKAVDNTRITIEKGTFELV